MTHFPHLFSCCRRTARIDQKYKLAHALKLINFYIFPLSFTNGTQTNFSLIYCQNILPNIVRSAKHQQTKLYQIIVFEWRVEWGWLFYGRLDLYYIFTRKKCLNIYLYNEPPLNLYEWVAVKILMVVCHAKCHKNTFYLLAHTLNHLIIPFSSSTSQSSSSWDQLALSRTHQHRQQPSPHTSSDYTCLEKLFISTLQQQQ